MRRWTLTIPRGALGLVFAWAGAAKLASPRLFFFALLDYRLGLPDAALRLTAVTLPWLELLVGGLLLANRWRNAALPLAAGLAGVFVAATAQAWARGLTISCGCFGAQEPGLWASPAVAFARAVAMLAAAGWLISRETSRLGTKKDPA